MITQLYIGIHKKNGGDNVFEYQQLKRFIVQVEAFSLRKLRISYKIIAQNICISINNIVSLQSGFRLYPKKRITYPKRGLHKKSNYKQINVMIRLSVIVCLFMFAMMSLLAQVKQTVAVLGDSYSTFEGFIPKGYATWYTTAVQKVTDVNKVEQTWWWQVIKEGGYKMGNINSYSGSTICNTGYRDEDYSDRSFINRTTLLGNPDIILICGGTNDSWANVPIGNYQYSN